MKDIPIRYIFYVELHTSYVILTIKCVLFIIMEFLVCTMYNACTVDLLAASRLLYELLTFYEIDKNEV